ncbi:serine/threonine protein kinase [Chloroflexota bacterium]
MRSLVRGIIERYGSPKLEGQDEGTISFSGQDPHSKQPVSIRILPRLLGSDPQIAARFRHLGRNIRQLNHPNVASIREVGDNGGLPYIVTRAIEKARPLAERLDQPWAIDAAADVTMQVGQALEHAYKKGLVHGSLSPENIVIQDDGHALVTDFGWVQMKELLGASVREGASPYLAPERVAGKPADARADVYSMGSVLYGMLTQRAPQVVKGDVLPPGRFNSDVPPEMDDVVVKALSPQPEDRYPDVKSFLVALGAVSLAPAVQRVRQSTPADLCPQCGAVNQSGSFCRKCGASLERPAAEPVPAPSKLVPPQSKLDEPIQITKVEVGRVEQGDGVEMHATTIARPMTVATGELIDLFPEPLAMPQIDTQSVLLDLGTLAALAMPEPPAMPVIDWAEAAPPMPEAPALATPEENDRGGD